MAKTRPLINRQVSFLRPYVSQRYIRAQETDWPATSCVFMNSSSFVIIGCLSELDDVGSPIFAQCGPFCGL